VSGAPERDRFAYGVRLNFRHLVNNISVLFSTEVEPTTPTISKAERDQEIHKFYRAELIQHLTNWPSTQLEKQVGK
jgi:hypothetical protein